LSLNFTAQTSNINLKFAPSLADIRLISEAIPFEDRDRFVPRDVRRYGLGDSRSDKVPNARPPKIVEHFALVFHLWFWLAARPSRFIEQRPARHWIGFLYPAAKAEFNTVITPPAAERPHLVRVSQAVDLVTDKREIFRASCAMRLQNSGKRRRYGRRAAFTVFRLSDV
jgi:hypothetical protein